MNTDDNLDLLDLDDSAEVDALPEATPFTTSRPKKPWLLMGLGLAIIVLATWIIVARIGGDNGTSVDVDLNAPVPENVDNVPAPVADLNVPAKPADVAPQPQPIVALLAQPKPEPKPVDTKPVDTKPVETDGTPVRVVADRKDVTFNPDKPVQQKKAPAKPAKKATKPVQKTATKPVTSSNGSIYVQFGSYGTRAAAQAAEQKIRASHSNLFSGKQFVILAAQVNGQTKYRLRVAFHNANDANGFCRNAKSDGLDCYVTK